MGKYDRMPPEDDVIEACIANMMARHGRVAGLRRALETHGAHALDVWRRMQEIHAADADTDDTPTACGRLKGSSSGASRHYRAKEPLCDPCRTAQNIANRAWRERARADNQRRDHGNSTARCGTDWGHSKHLEHGDTPCEPCVAAHLERRARLVDDAKVDRWCAGETSLGLTIMEKREVIRARLRDGWTAAQIGADLGLTAKSVQRAISRHRLRDGRPSRHDYSAGQSLNLSGIHPHLVPA